MPRSPLTETYEKVNDIFQTINALEPDQRNLLLDWLFPEPEPVQKPAKKKSSKKPAGKGGGGKSKHASSLAEKVGGTLASIAKTVGGDDEGAQKVLNAIDDSVSDRCQFKREDGRTCMLLPDHNIHHLATVMDHHQFVAPPATHAATGD